MARTSVPLQIESISIQREVLATASHTKRRPDESRRPSSSDSATHLQRATLKNQAIPPPVPEWENAARPSSPLSFRIAKGPSVICHCFQNTSQLENLNKVFSIEKPALSTISNGFEQLDFSKRKEESWEHLAWTRSTTTPSSPQTHPTQRQEH